MTAGATALPASPSLEHLRARLRVLDGRIRAAVDRRRASDPAPDDPFRGLYLSEANVAAILTNGHAPIWDADPDGSLSDLERVEVGADLGELAGEILRLRRLAETFDLDLLDTELLLVALAPDLDSRIERLYGYLHDDVARRRASVGLALELAGLATDDGAARDRLSPAGALMRGGLVLLEEADRPFLSRTLRVPDRVVAHLLEADRLAPEVEDVCDVELGPPWAGRLEPLERALSIGLRPVFLRESGTASGFVTANTAATALEAPCIAIDLRRLAAAARPEEVAARAILEARLARALLVAGPVEAIADRSPGAIGRFADAPCPVVLVGARAWNPDWSLAAPLQLDAPPLSPVERAEAWHEALTSDERTGIAAERETDFAAATEAFRLNAAQIARAAEGGRRRARVDRRSLQPSDLQAGARAQNAAGLERLAHRVAPAAGWDDLVVPADVGAQLQELAARARHRGLVVDGWGIGARSSRGRGVTALFAGESGTGKTLGAEAIAAYLGLDMYVVDLSTVVDKYIGETEKNLDRIFTEADRVNGVLLFDEADAIFGKRSEVRDARDRYANVEVAYLLQRMERFEGLAVLTTNLRANLDESFTRRIDIIVDFPLPDEAARHALWRMHLPPGLPHADDIDLGFLARRFHLAGGSIRNVCLAAAFLAVDAASPITMAHLIRATEREYRKMGRLTLEAEFGPYFALVTRDPVEVVA